MSIEKVSLNKESSKIVPYVNMKRAFIPTEESYWKMVIRRYKKHKLAVVGIFFLAIMILMAIFAPLISPYNPYEITDSFSAKPSSQHWLGTDDVGRDLLSRLIYASRVSLLVGIGAVLISVTIGTLLGLFAGFFGGKIDMMIMRFTDIFMSFPHLMIILVVVSVLGPNLLNILAVIGLLFWTGITRIVRGTVLQIREQEYVKACIVLGLSTSRIIFHHILPNALGPILVFATFGVANVIILEASLSFLGFGVQPPIASWGNMLGNAQSLTILSEKPWLWVPPGLCIMLSVLAVNFIGDGLRDALDPKNIK